MEIRIPQAIHKKESWTSALADPKFISLLFLGFASGLPLLLTGSTLQAWYAVSGVSIVSIGALTLVGQPYVYKFLWAPLLDRFPLPWLGRRRGWIVILQLTLAVTIMMMGFLQPNDQPLALASLAVVVAFLSATQDIEIDAFRTEVLSPQERGIGAALYTMGYRIAMLFTGAIALVMADHIGWQLTYWIMASLMFIQIVVTLLSKNPPQEIIESKRLLLAISEPFSAFFKQRYALAIVLFIIIYKLSDVFTLVLGTAFLIRGVGFSLTDIGLMYKLVGMLGIFLGVGIGGLWMKRLSLMRALVIFGIIQTLTNLPFLALAIIGKNYALLVITILVENIGSGMGSVAFLAFIMGLCDHRYTATHFAFLSAIASTGRVFAGPLAGMMVASMGWINFYIFAFLIGFPGIIMLVYLKNHRIFSNTKLVH